MKTVAKAIEPADRQARFDHIQPLYLEALTLVERLHRRLLDVIKDEFDRRGRADINAVQALLLFNIGDKELTAGELRTRGYYLGSNVSYNLKKLVEMGFLDHQRSRVDRRSVRIKLTEKGREVRNTVRRALQEARAHGRAGRRHHGRRVRDAEQVAAAPRALLDRPDPLSALIVTDRNFFCRKGEGCRGAPLILFVAQSAMNMRATARPTNSPVARLSHLSERMSLTKFTKPLGGRAVGLFQVVSERLSSLRAQRSNPGPHRKRWIASSLHSSQRRR